MTTDTTKKIKRMNAVNAAEMEAREHKIEEICNAFGIAGDEDRSRHDVPEVRRDRDGILLPELEREKPIIEALRVLGRASVERREVLRDKLIHFLETSRKLPSDMAADALLDLLADRYWRSLDG